MNRADPLYLPDVNVYHVRSFVSLALVNEACIPHIKQVQIKEAEMNVSAPLWHVSLQMRCRNCAGFTAVRLLSEH